MHVSMAAVLEAVEAQGLYIQALGGGQHWKKEQMAGWGQSQNRGWRRLVGGGEKTIFDELLVAIHRLGLSADICKRSGVTLETVLQLGPGCNGTINLSLYPLSHKPWLSLPPKQNPR